MEKEKHSSIGSARNPSPSQPAKEEALAGFLDGLVAMQER